MRYRLLKLLDANPRLSQRDVAHGFQLADRQLAIRGEWVARNKYKLSIGPTFDVESQEMIALHRLIVFVNAE